jgi:hypothetical protein
MSVKNIHHAPGHPCSSADLDQLCSIQSTSSVSTLPPSNALDLTHPASFGATKLANASITSTMRVEEIVVSLARVARSTCPSSPAQEYDTASPTTASTPPLRSSPVPASSLVHLPPATVPPREPLLHEVPLRWPRQPSHDDALLAHSLRHQGCSAFAQPAPSPRSTPRLPCRAQCFSRARACGEGGEDAAWWGRHAAVRGDESHAHAQLS